MAVNEYLQSESPGGSGIPVSLISIVPESVPLSFLIVNVVSLVIPLFSLWHVSVPVHVASSFVTVQPGPASSLPPSDELSVNVESFKSWQVPVLDASFV